MSQLDWYIRANLKPRHLQMMVALDDLRHLGRVAQSLHVSQPAVSLALGELEKGLGFKLFDRTPKGVVPNAYGESLIQHARLILGNLTQMRHELHALQSGASGKVHVGALPAMTPSLLPQATNAAHQCDRARRRHGFALARTAPRHPGCGGGAPGQSQGSR
jgi:DNA-binding transcriptional LysR family regulator